MIDIVDEVQQEMQYEKYELFFINHGKKLITAAVIIIVLTAIYSIYKNHNDKKSKAVGTMFLNAFNDTKPENYDAIIEKKHKAYSPLAGLVKGGLLNSEEKYGEAAKALEGVSGGKYDKAFEHIAMIDQAYIMIEQKADKEKILSMLEKPSQEGAPFKATAKELKASYLLQTGDKKTAREIYSELANNKEIPSTMQERAKQILATIQ